MYEVVLGKLRNVAVICLRLSGDTKGSSER